MLSPTPPTPARTRGPARLVLAAAVLVALGVLVVVAVTRPKENAGVGVGGPTSRPSVTAAPSGGPAPSGGTAFVPARVAVTLQPYVAGLDAPLAIAHAGDGSGRLFVAEQGGKVRIVRDGTLDPTPFLDIGARITSGGERGLLGLAFHPRFPDDPRVFVDYTDTAGDTQVSSFALDPTDADRLDPSSEQRLLHVTQPFANHNGGALVFDRDGLLLIALGDGGSGGDPQGNGQKLTTLLGKILRIDIDAGAAGGRGYGIPTDNPYADGAGGRLPEIWLSGLRNPWRMSVDRATGDLWIGDVGQNAWEEIDVQRVGTPGGTNFGWNRMEGTHCFEPKQGCEDPTLVLPVSDYGHDLGCTVIGGGVYRGSAQAALVGGYVFGDYCSGRVWAIDPASDAYQSPVEVNTGGHNLSAFGEDEAGELFAADISAGEVVRVSATRR